MIALQAKLAGIQVGEIVEIHTDDRPKPSSQHQLDGDAVVTAQLDRYTDLEISPRSVIVRVLDVWPHRHGGNIVRARVELIADLPNLLHKRPWHHNTHNPAEAMRDEPESVDKNAQRRITEQADTVYLATHADEHRRKEARSIAAQTKEAVSRAWRQGINIDENLERIRSEVNAILRKSGRDAA